MATKLTPVQWLLLFAVSSVLLWWGYTTFAGTQCTICSDYMYIGRVVDIQQGKYIDIGSKVAQYNSQIASSGKVVLNAEQYSGCQVYLSALSYFKQSGVWKQTLWTSSDHGYTSKAGGSSMSEGIKFMCPGNYQAVVDYSLKSCTITPDTLLGQTQTYINHMISSNADAGTYSECLGVAGADIYIPKTAIRTKECEVGQVQTKACGDGTSITSAACVNYLWKTSTEKCPTCTNNCGPGQSRKSYPDCSCYCKTTCSAGKTQQADCSCKCTQTCPTGQTQNADCTCSGGTPGASDQDCGATHIDCTISSKVCTSGVCVIPTCTLDTDCSAGKYCSSGSCVGCPLYEGMESCTWTKNEHGCNIPDCNNECVPVTAACGTGIITTKECIDGVLTETGDTCTAAPPIDYTGLVVLIGGIAIVGGGIYYFTTRKK